VLWLCGAMAFLPACSGKDENKPLAKPPVPVITAAVIRKAVPLQLSAIGHVEAFSTIAVKSQVDGILSNVHIRAGQDVNEGDLLFTIDPRPYQAALKEAEAALARDRAQLKNAAQDAERYRQLLQKGSVSEQQYDRIRTNMEALEAVVNADQANLENAELQLGYCYIHTPVTGRTGDLTIDEGNLVKANDDKLSLVTIRQIEPIYVQFSLPEESLPKIKQYMAENPLQVEAFLNKGADQPTAKGVLSFVDNTVDRNTGSITLKGTFENRDRTLWPGQFVNVALTLTTQADALAVASRAIQVGQSGPYVFVSKPDLTVELRPVAIDRVFGPETIVEQGLVEGENVVVEGQLRLIPGAKVQLQGSPAGKGNSPS
jgi:multidrug efflux system membrane fusion protein